MMRRYTNALRRWLVKRLLGTHLVIEKRDTPFGHEWQLIDLQRRIPYGWVRAEKIGGRDFRIIPLPAYGRKIPSQSRNE